MFRWTKLKRLPVFLEIRTSVFHGVVYSLLQLNAIKCKTKQFQSIFLTINYLKAEIYLLPVVDTSTDFRLQSEMSECYLAVGLIPRNHSPGRTWKNRGALGLIALIIVASVYCIGPKSWSDCWKLNCRPTLNLKLCAATNAWTKCHKPCAERCNK